MYAERSEEVSVNKLHYYIFSAKRGELKSKSGTLPPSQNPLQQHCRHVNYVVGIWRCWDEAIPAIPSLTGRGWHTENDHLAYTWMTCQPTPSDVLKIIICDCKKQCATPACPCEALGIVCIEACKLQGCNNCAPLETEDVASESDSDSDD